MVNDEERLCYCWYCLHGTLEFDTDYYNPRTDETTTVLECNHCGAVWEGTIIDKY